MTVINFTKMHGIGNDYVYINDTESIIKNPNELSKKLVIDISVLEVMG